MHTRPYTTRMEWSRHAVGYPGRGGNTVCILTRQGMVSLWRPRKQLLRTKRYRAKERPSAASRGHLWPFWSPFSQLPAPHTTFM